MTRAEFENIDRQIWANDTEGEIGHEVEWRRDFYGIAGGKGYNNEEIQGALQQNEDEWGPRRALEVRAAKNGCTVEKIIKADALARERDIRRYGKP